MGLCSEFNRVLFRLEPACSLCTFLWHYIAYLQAWPCSNRYFAKQNKSGWQFQHIVSSLNWTSTHIHTHTHTVHMHRRSQTHRLPLRFKRESSMLMISSHHWAAIYLSIKYYPFPSLWHFNPKEMKWWIWVLFKFNASRLVAKNSRCSVQLFAEQYSICLANSWTRASFCI